MLKKEIVEILKNNDNNDELFKTADKIRHDYVGDEVHLRGLIEFSNICKRNCFYCGLRFDNKKIERYRILKDELINCASQAVELGYKTIVLQSGEDNYYNIDLMCEIISEIKKLNVALTLSIGEKSYEEYKAYKEAGADRYLLRIETTDYDLYKKMHPNMSLDNRKDCLYNLRSLGYEVGTGCLVGLKGQSIESLADDILFFKELNADMVGIGPYIVHPDTPLADNKNGDFILALKVMALTRINLPDINIPATTAMETINPNGRLIALQSGANVVMPNATYIGYRNKYEIYPNKICINDKPEQCFNCMSAKLKSINRTISSDFGFRKKLS